MEFKQSNFLEIIESEREMVLSGFNRYKNYFTNASELNGLLQEFVKFVNPDRFIFVMFLAQIRKHHTLALFSSLRLHHVQAMMDLRQVLEAGSCAVFSIKNPEEKWFADSDENGILNASQKLTGYRNKWLSDNFPKESKQIKDMKDIINASTAHSNVIYAHNTFSFDEKEKNFKTPFFDIEDDYFVKADLWQIGNIAIMLMNFIFVINQKLNAIEFNEDFLSKLRNLEIENNKIRADMMSTERYKRTEKMRLKNDKTVQGIKKS